MGGSVRGNELAQAGGDGRGAFPTVLRRGEHELAVFPLDLYPDPVGALVEVVEAEREQLALAQAEGGTEVAYELVAGEQAAADTAEFGGLPRDDQAFGPPSQRLGRCGGGDLAGILGVEGRGMDWSRGGKEWNGPARRGMERQAWGRRSGGPTAP
jgi:hypothetical protein